MEESAFLSPDFPNVVTERNMQTLSNIGTAEPTGWICMRNAFVNLCWVGDREAQVNEDPLNPHLSSWEEGICLEHLLGLQSS